MIADDNAMFKRREGISRGMIARGILGLMLALSIAADVVYFCLMIS